MMSKADLTAILHRVGVDDATIHKLLEPLPDPVDLDKEGPYLYRHGISLDRIIDRLGGSS